MTLDLDSTQGTDNFNTIRADHIEGSIIRGSSIDFGEAEVTSVNATSGTFGNLTATSRAYLAQADVAGTVTGTRGVFTQLDAAALNGSNVSGSIGYFHTLHGSIMSGTQNTIKNMVGSILSGSQATLKDVIGSQMSGSVLDIKAANASMITGSQATVPILVGSSFTGSLVTVASKCEARFVLGSTIKGSEATIPVFTGSAITGSIATIPSIVGSTITGSEATVPSLTGSIISGSEASLKDVIGSQISGSIATLKDMVGSQMSGSSLALPENGALGGMSEVVTGTTAAAGVTLSINHSLGVTPSWVGITAYGQGDGSVTANLADKGTGTIQVESAIGTVAVEAWVVK